MGCYRRSSRFIFDSFSCCNLKIRVPKNPIQESISRRDLHAFSSRSCFNGGSRIIPQSSQPIFWNSALQNGAKRFYCSGRNHRGYERWIQNSGNAILSIVAFGSAAAIAVFSGNWATVPLTERAHFVNFPKFLENKLEEMENVMESGRKILPPLHPHSIRARRILQDILEGLEREGVSDEAVRALSERESDDDDELVEESRQNGEENGMKSQNGKLKWEIVVADKPVVAAVCAPGGKIIVSNVLLNHFRDYDAVIATIIGHEVGHALARHTAEKLSKFLRLAACLWLILNLFFVSAFVNSMPYLVKFLRLPFSRSFICLATLVPVSLLPMMMYSRKMELEADYIGLMLAASAGYNPRLAPPLFEQYGYKGPLPEYFHAHPSGKKRAQNLARAEVMNEALSRYRKAQAARGVAWV